MNWKRIMFAGLALLALPLAARAQETTTAQTPSGSSIVPLRIQVTFSEFEAEKKVSSLPYVLNHNADRGRETRTSMRMGIRVPIMASPPNSTENRVQYQNVGTDIDCWVRADANGMFRLTMELRRSSLYTPGADTKQVEWKPNDPAMPGSPFFREFSGRVDALLRDGQTSQSSMATDPVSGRTLRVDVTLTVVK